MNGNYAQVGDANDMDVFTLVTFCMNSWIAMAALEEMQCKIRKTMATWPGERYLRLHMTMSLYSLFFVWFEFLLRWLLLETEFWSECSKAWTLAAGLLQPEWSTACRRCRTLEVRWMMVVACCPSIHFPRLFFKDSGSKMVQYSYSFPLDILDSDGCRNHRRYPTCWGWRNFWCAALGRMRPLGCPTFVESIETCSFRDQIALGDGCWFSHV